MKLTGYLSLAAHSELDIIHNDMRTYYLATRNDHILLILTSKKLIRCLMGSMFTFPSTVVKLKTNGPQGSWNVSCLYVKMEFRSCTGEGVSGVASCITTDEQLQ